MEFACIAILKIFLYICVILICFLIEILLLSSSRKVKETIKKKKDSFDILRDFLLFIVYLKALAKLFFYTHTY